MVSKCDGWKNGGWILVEIGEALFHGFGVDFEEIGDSCGNFTTAIVEFSDGRIENIPVENIRFLGPIFMKNYTNPKSQKLNYP